MRNIVLGVLVCTLSLAPGVTYAKERAQKVIHKCSKKDNSVKSLACNVYMEARGETVNGQMAVAFVTMNRMKHDKFPTTMKGVVYQSSQFSWTLVKSDYRITDKDSWEAAINISKFVHKIKDNELLYKRLDPTYGSLYYHTKKVKPVWRKLLKRTVTIENHVFYKDKEEKKK
jgi:N-acetylmuramoyl-L-alanine amidase